MTTSDRIAAMMRHLGYKIIETGGGCTAWFRDLDIHGEHFYILVTDEYGASIPDRWDVGVVMGLYIDDGQSRLYMEFDSIVEIPDANEFRGMYDDYLKLRKGSGDA